MIAYLLYALMAFQENPEAGGEFQQQRPYRFEEPKEPQPVVDPELMPVQTVWINVHPYYLSQTSLYGDAAIVFAAKRTDIYRRYIFKVRPDPGEPAMADVEVTEDEFYDRIFKWLRYGTPDSVNDTHYVNLGFTALMKDLVKHKLLAPSVMKELARHYTNMKWGESAYYLDELFPGSVTKEQWQVMVDDTNLCHYFKTLARIKLAATAEDLERARKFLDDELSSNFTNNVQKNYFVDFAKAYAVLQQKGVVFPAELQFHLLGAYLNETPAEKPFVKYYPRFGLSVPDKDVLYRTLILRVKLAIDKPMIKYVNDFRRFQLEFPKEYAGKYRDAALSDFGTCDLEDVYYLIRAAGEDAPPELWKKFGDQALSWHFQHETRIRDLDSGDYYHQAVEAYRHVAAFRRVCNDQKRLKELEFGDRQRNLLLDGRGDPSAKVADVIGAYKLLGHNPKEEAVLNNLDARVAAEDVSLTGAYYDRALGVILWNKNLYGQRLIPFENEIALAAYLNDPERTKRLSAKIADFALANLTNDGAMIGNLYFDGVVSPKNPANLQEELDAEFRSCDTPAFMNLDAVLEIYRAAHFNDGLASIAFHLRDNGFVLAARRAYKLAGVTEAEEQVYSKHDDAFWQKQQEDFNLRMRK